MKPIVMVVGPRDAGPGERDLMLARAGGVFEEAGADPVTRVDVPGRGSGEDVSDAGMRVPVQAVVPALQSGSLFGDGGGLLVVDAHAFLAAEAEVIAEVLEAVGPALSVVAVFVAAGSVPAPLGKVLRELGDVITVKKLSEKGAAEWIRHAARDRSLRLGSGAADALVDRFGTDVASIGQALDQLAAAGGVASADAVRSRFKNRPDEPTWHYMDAIAAGDQGEALRRLADFLHHGHPLVLVATLHNDLRRRSLSAAAPDYDTFAEWDGGARNYGMEKVWKQRGRVRASDLALALDAVARADVALKTTPEATHRVLLERLTVALCRWYGRSR